MTDSPAPLGTVMREDYEAALNREEHESRRLASLVDATEAERDEALAALRDAGTATTALLQSLMKFVPNGDPLKPEFQREVDRLAALSNQEKP